MTRPLAIALLATALAAPAFAQSAPDPVRLMREVCIAGRFDREATERLVSAHASGAGARADALPPETIRRVNAAATSGWAFRQGTQTASVMLARRPLRGFESRSCNIVVEGLTYEDAKRLITAAFNATPLGERAEGAGTQSVFSVELPGFSNRTAFSVLGNPTLGVTSITLMELPPG